MADSFLKMLAMMGTEKSTSTPKSSKNALESADLDAPQLRLSPNMANRLEEVMQASLGNQYTPMDK